MTLNICSDVQTRETRWVDNSKSDTPQPAYVVAGEYRIQEPVPQPIIIK